MATNIFEIPDKYVDRLTWNMIYFIQKRQFCVFFQILLFHRWRDKSACGIRTLTWEQLVSG